MLQNHHIEPARVRIYAFDTLRTVMVLFGIAIHASIIYSTNVFKEAVFYNDPQSHSIFFNILADLIHIFRMPIFYILSGFLTALLLHDRGVKNLIYNRLHRLVYPFLAGLVVLFPIHIYSLSFFGASLSHQENPYVAALGGLKSLHLRDVHTVHLWFLYYLIWFCATALLVNYCINRWFSGWNGKPRQFFLKLFRWKIAPVVFAIPTALCLYWMRSFDIDASHSFIPDIKFFLTYILFFAFGWLCYTIKDDLFRFEKQVYPYLVIAVFLFIVRWMYFYDYEESESTTNILILMLALTVWFFIFGIIGFFLKYFNKPSAVSRYISDGSYWIYLIHMPIVLFVQGLLIPYTLSPFLKFLMVMAITLIITVLSYNYLVRNTFIGNFLNGRKSPRPF